MSTIDRHASRTLLVARESSSGAEAIALLDLLFRSLVREVEGMHIALPDFKSVVDVYEHPERYGATVHQSPGMRAVLVTGEECDVLLSLGSARKLNEKGDNAFVEALCEIIDSGEYTHVMTTTISRLCRNTVAAARIKYVLETNRVILLVAGKELKVWDSPGDILFAILTWFSEFEARQIEARLLAGKISRAEAGHWTFGFAPPPGWKLDEEGQIILDPTVAEAVSWVIARVCDGETNFARLGRDVKRMWPDLQARRGTSTWGSKAAGTSIRRSWLNPTWFSAYTSNTCQIEFVPHAAKKARRKRLSLSEGEVVTVEMALPPHPKPIAAEKEIMRLQDQLAGLAEVPQRRGTGWAFGAGESWDPSEVEILEVG